MKALSYIAAFFAFIFISVYILLFTSIGNTLISPYINDKISQALNLPTKIENFRLSTSKIALAVDIDGKNKLLVAGKYSLVNLDFNLIYDVAFNDISSFSKLAKQPLQGNLNTKGKIEGNLENILVKGTSDIASSDTKYQITLNNNTLENIQLVMKNGDISGLLYMIKQKPIIKGELNINTEISSFDPDNLLGNINGYVSNGIFNTEIIKKDFKLDIPQTRFISKFDAALNKDVTYNVNFDSTLAKLDSKGKIKAQNQEIKSDFSLFISKLELLESAIGMKLKGKLALNGNIAGDKNEALLTLKSDLANSDTALKVKLKEFQPKSLEGKIEKLDLSQILYMINQPPYLKKGLLDMELDIKSLEKENLKGDIKTTIANILLNNQTIKKQFNQELPKNTTLSADLLTKLDKTSALTTGEINSSIANILIKSLAYDTKNNSIDAKSVLNIENLSTLESLAGRKLRGNAQINIASLINENFTLNSDTDILEGHLKTATLNEKTDIAIKDIDVSSALYMLYYPQVYSGKGNGTINIDTKEESAQFNIDLKNGHFEENELTLLLANALKLDLTNENFSYAVVKGTKKKDIIDADITMESDNLKISTKRCVIDTKKQIISSVLAFKYRHYDFDVVIKGDLKSPKVSSKIAQTILKEKAKDKLEKNLGDKLGDDVKGLLQNLLKF